MSDHPNCSSHIWLLAGDYKGTEMEKVRGALLSRLVSMFICMTDALKVCVCANVDGNVCTAPNLILWQFHELYKCEMMT